MRSSMTCLPWPTFFKRARLSIVAYRTSSTAMLANHLRKCCYWPISIRTRVSRFFFSLGFLVLGPLCRANLYAEAHDRAHGNVDVSAAQRHDQSQAVRALCAQRSHFAAATIVYQHCYARGDGWIVRNASSGRFCSSHYQNAQNGEEASQSVAASAIIYFVLCSYYCYFKNV